MARTVYEEIERRAQRLRDSAVGERLELSLADCKACVQITMTPEELSKAATRPMYQKREL